ncbi:hypothetical protein MTP99_016645 [Tenebrio molitor]|nr:hypothetical protein MTP99_016645 [Tenebrio molitor]
MAQRFESFKSKLSPKMQHAQKLMVPKPAEKCFLARMSSRYEYWNLVTCFTSEKVLWSAWRIRTLHMRLINLSRVCTILQYLQSVLANRQLLSGSLAQQTLAIRKDWYDSP